MSASLSVSRSSVRATTPGGRSCGCCTRSKPTRPSLVRCRPQRRNSVDRSSDLPGHLAPFLVHLYSPSLPLQTGSTLFHTLRAAPPPQTSILPYPPPLQPYWTYDKTEFAVPMDPSAARAQAYTHVILEGGQFERDAWRAAGWELIGSRSGFGGIGLSRIGPARGAKQRWTIPGLGWEVSVKQGTTVDLIRRVDWP